jgi:8-oxo-dGTP pyrophosphatase MutT (NUDIX family)
MDDGMTSAVIHRVTELDLICDSWAWPFASERRPEIDAHFARAQSLKPEIFNGRILMARDPVFAEDRFAARYFETDFASFLAWRDWGFPDTSVFNGFGMGALRSSDGAYVLGEMAGHTANAGRIYFPSGTPDRNDLRGDRVDIAESVVREVTEETGLSPADYRAAADWQCVVTRASIAMMRILDVAMSGEALCAAIEANLAKQTTPELSAMHVVRSTADFAPTMPVFVTAFIAAQLKGVA